MRTARPQPARPEPERTDGLLVPVEPRPQPVDARLSAAVHASEARQAPATVEPEADRGPTIEVTIGSVEILAPEPDLDRTPQPARAAPDFRYMDDARRYADRRWY